MQEKSEAERSYEEYLKRDDLTVSVDSRKYYRIFRKTCMTVREKTVFVTVPKELFGHRSYLCRVIDENDAVFETGQPVHIRFHGELPRWYLETVVLPVKGVSETDGVGDYLALWEEETV